MGSAKQVLPLLSQCTLHLSLQPCSRTIAAIGPNKSAIEGPHLEVLLPVAEVEKTGKSDIEEAAGVVSVRLRGRYRTWPKWGRDLLWVANDMANTLSFWRRPTVYDKKKVEDSMKVLYS